MTQTANLGKRGLDRMKTAMKNPKWQIAPFFKLYRKLKCKMRGGARALL